MLEVRLIDRFEIQHNGKTVLLSSRAAQSLFAYLILTAGIMHRREKLAGIFWPDSPEEKARTYLRHELWRIRKALSPEARVAYILADGINIAFNPSAEYWLDVAVLANAGERASIQELRDALAVYHGELLPGFYEEWLILAREQLQTVYEQKIARLLELLEKEKCWNEILEWAERWISLGGSPESAFRYLMVAYDALGDRAKVASTYERCIQTLRELDLEPSEQTRAILFKRTSKLNIPIPLTSFIGRANELNEISALLSKSRLVTLTGSGGVGKTRLAIQVVPDVMAWFPDGIWFLDLAPLIDPFLVPSTLANLLGLRESGEISVTDLLVNYFRSRTALVIFDNCEHLIDSCAQLINSLLTSCENLAVLATSRETLRVSGEMPYRVPSLEIPKSDVGISVEDLAKIESVRLFIERASPVSSRFTVQSQDVLVICQIARRLDGIPLALELAAVRVGMLSVAQILRHLDDRFKLLTNGLRSALPRHQTLRAMIEWSYDLLSEKERVLFRRLAVFMGGWTLESAEAVCAGDDIGSGEVLEILSQLVNKSLVLSDESSNGTRYRILETLRQYANERLVVAGESDILRDKHLEYFLDVAETAQPHLICLEQLEWLARLDADYENLSAALEWALCQEAPESSFRFCVALSRFWVVRCYWLEGSTSLERALRKKSQVITREQKVALTRALYTDAELAERLSDLERMRISANASLALATEVSDQQDTAIARFYVGLSLIRQGNYGESRQLLSQCLAEFQGLNNVYWESRSYNALSLILVHHGEIKYIDSVLGRLDLDRKAGERLNLAESLLDYSRWLYDLAEFDQAKTYAEEADRFLREIDSKLNRKTFFIAAMDWLRGDYQKARSLYNEMKDRYDLFGEKNAKSGVLEYLGLLEMEEGNLYQSKKYLEEALALAKELRKDFSLAWCLSELGNLFYQQGDTEKFKQNVRESISLAKGISRFGKAHILNSIVRLNFKYFQSPESAAWLLGTIHKFEKEDERPIDPLYDYGRAEAYVRKALGDVAFESALARGEKLPLDAALDLALRMVEEL